MCPQFMFLISKSLLMLCTIKICRNLSKFSFDHPLDELSRIIDYNNYPFYFVFESDLPPFSKVNLVG